MQTDIFNALVVREAADKTFTQQIEERKWEDLPEGEVLIRVQYSSLNYKDALSATGHKGVTRNYPHTPGIDAAGWVVSSQSHDFSVGDPVIVTSYDLGMNTAGGYGEYIRVPASWVVPCPEGISLKASMVYGTAGFTAALALHKLETNGASPKGGPVAVSGASGGVGSMAVAILSHLGYEVIAASGKTAAYDWLRNLGAKEVVGREEIDDSSGRPLLRPRYAGAIDTVGGNTLHTLLKLTQREGSVAACGLVQSPKLTMTVYPFILNGVNLLGVDSATCPMPLRRALWNKLANEWKPAVLTDMAAFCSLEELPSYFPKILAGKQQGRLVVQVGEKK